MADGKKLPFQLGTRRNSVRGNSATTQNLTGGVLAIPLPKNGYGSKLTVTVTLAFTGTGSGTPAWGNALEQAMALIPQVRTYNNANVNQLRMSLYGLALRSRHERRGWNIAHGPSWKVDLPSTATSAHVIQMQFEVNFTPNQGPNFMRGLLPLQAIQSQWTLELTLAPLAQVISGIGAPTGTIQVDTELDYYEQPDLTRFAPPPLNYLYIQEEELITTGLNGQGFEYQVAPLQGDLMRLYGQFVYGSTPASYTGYAMKYDNYRAISGPYITDIGLTLGNINSPVFVSAAAADNRYRRDYGQTPQPGVVMWLDAATDLDRPNEYSFPDFYKQFISPSKFADVRFKASTNPNGGTPAFVRVIKEYFQEIAFSA